MDIAFLLRDWHSIGGIQRNAQAFCQAVRDLGHTMVLMTPSLGLLLSWHVDVVVIGHINLLPLTWLIPPGRQIWLVIYGIESWKRLSIMQRIGLWRVSKVVAISQYTIDQARPFLRDQHYTVLPCTC